VLATVLFLALTRAEIIARMKAPVVTQCEGLVQVYADCSEDLRREYQMPIASFAAETVKTLNQGLSVKPKRYRDARIIVHVGDARTNDASVVSRTVTNGTKVVSRIYLRSPGYSDLSRFRLEIVKAFGRTVLGEEIDDAAALATYRKADPRFRVSDEHSRLMGWLAGTMPSPTPEDDEENLSRMRRVIEPGVSTRADVMVFASRLFLYPAAFDAPFCGKFGCLSFREAIACAKADPFVRLAAIRKSGLVIVYGGGRSEQLSEASKLYFEFLLELAKKDAEEENLLELIEKADNKLNEALEQAVDARRNTQ